MRITSRRVPALALTTALAAVIVTAITAPAAGAQDVQYTTVTKVDLGGGMNAIMRMAGASDVKETAYIKGKKLRSDGEKQSTIFDLDNNQYIILNHGEKTYTKVALADMARLATAPMRGVRAETSNDQLKGTARDSAGNKADFVVDVKVDPTKERRNINGNDAERVIIEMETDVKVTPQGESQAQDAGKLVVVMDTWNAKTGPAADAIRAWEQTASKEIAAAAFGSRANMGPAMAANPRMGEAMKKAAEEAQKVEGVAVLSVMHLVIVAPGQPYSRELALKGSESGGAAPAEQRRGGLRGMIGRAVEANARSQEKNRSEQQQQQTQGTFAKVTTEMRDIQSTTVPASMFEIPAGYREVKFEPPPAR